MPEETTLDVKPTSTDSSTVDSAKVAAEDTKTTSQSKTDVKEPQSMAEVAAQVAKAHNIGMEDSSTSKVEGEEEGAVQKINRTEDKEEGEVKKEETPPGDKTQEKVEEIDENNPPETIPYTRFKEVNEKAKQFEEQYQAAEPVVKSHKEIVDYCRNQGISQEQFKEGLELMSLINSNPVKAVEVLTSVVEQLQGFIGDKLPSDLQKKVDDGKLDLEDAKELASLRAKSKFGESKLKQTKESQAKATQEKFLRDVQVATSSWEKNVSKTDLDFREGTDKHRMVVAQYSSMANERKQDGSFVNPIESVEDHIKLFQKAYEFVNSFTSKLSKANKPNGKKVLTSTASSTTAEQEPTSMLEIARKVGSKHGISI